MSDPQDLFRLIFEASATGMVLVDQSRRIALVNRALTALFGYAAGELIGQPLEILVPDLSAGQMLVGHRKDGAIIPIEIALNVVDTPNGRFSLASVVDITARHEIDQQEAATLRASEESNQRLELLHRVTASIGGREDLGDLYQQVMATLRDHVGFDFGCICAYDAARHQLTIHNLDIPDLAIANRLPFVVGSDVPIEGVALTGAVAGSPVYETALLRDTPACQALSDGGLTSLFAAPLRVERDVFGVLLVARTAPDAFSDGERDFLERLSQHVALAARQAELYSALQAAYDDLQQTQQAIIEQERLRVIGQMASGIAHDINNGISPVSLYTETILESEPGLSAESREYLRTIQRAIDDVGQTLGRLSDFSRRRVPALALNPIDLNPVIEQVKTLTRARWKDMPLLRGHVIEMQTEPAPDLPQVLGVESEIREALTNLVINAVDAMPTGGVVTIRTRIEAHQRDGTNAPLVAIEVTDTGIGMNAEIRQRCLEPFFTTKGQFGTGLGLAMVHGVAQRHNAQLEIESGVGTGTTVRILFSVHEGTSGSGLRNHQALAYQRLRILAIDDNPVLIRSLRDVLERDGHLVATASGGAAGLDVLQRALEHGESFDVVLTDLAMPNVDGYKVATAVKQHGESIRVVLMTGWGRHLPGKELPPHVDHVLSKPPRLHELRAALAPARPVQRITA